MKNSSKRELNQFTKYPVIIPDGEQKDSSKLGILSGALFGFAAISLIYSVSLLVVLSVLRAGGAIAWSLSFVQSLAMCSVFVLVRTLERALSAVSRKSRDSMDVSPSRGK